MGAHNIALAIHILPLCRANRCLAAARSAGVEQATAMIATAPISISMAYFPATIDARFLGYSPRDRQATV